MAISCAIGRHEVVARGIRNGKYEFGRCLRCACDMMRSDTHWKRVPRGFKVVWKPTGSEGSRGGPPAAAAIGRQVDLRGVTVVGERRYGAQRFALVVLNARDQRSYRDMIDQPGTSGRISNAMENSSLIGRATAMNASQAPARLSDMVAGARDAFGWEKAYAAPKAIPQR